MSAKRTEYVTLKCDEPGCRSFIEAEDGGELVFRTIDEARHWADDLEWGRVGDQDYCWDHRRLTEEGTNQ